MNSISRRSSPLGGLVILLSLLVAPVVGAAAEDVGGAERRLVFGSYADPANAAEDAAAIEAALGIDTELVPVEVDGREVVRLTSPVLVGDAIWPLTARAAEVRIEAWTWRLAEE